MQIDKIISTSSTLAPSPAPQLNAIACGQMGWRVGVIVNKKKSKRGSIKTKAAKKLFSYE